MLKFLCSAPCEPLLVEVAVKIASRMNSATQNKKIFSVLDGIISDV